MDFLLYIGIGLIFTGIGAVGANAHLARVHKKQISSLNEDVQLASEGNKEKIKNIKALKDHITTLEAAVESMKAKELQLVEEYNSNQDYQENNKLKKKNNVLQDMLDKNKYLIEDKEAEIKQLKDNVSEENSENEKLKIKLSNLSSLIEAKDKTIAEKKHLEDQLSKGNQEKASHIKTLEEQLSHQNYVIETKEDEIEKLQQIIKRKNEVIEDNNHNLRMSEALNKEKDDVISKLTLNEGLTIPDPLNVNARVKLRAIIDKLGNDTLYDKPKESMSFMDTLKCYIW